MRLTVCNLKGGVGKSTSSVFLACSLAKSGKTLLIDADPQGSTLSWSEDADSDLPCTVIAWPTRDLAKRVRGIASDYDHIVIDTAPQHEYLVRQALMISETVLVPIAPSLMDASRLGTTFDVIEEIRSVQDLDCHVLLTKVRGGTRSAREAREGLEAQGFPIMTTEVHLRESYPAAVGTVPRDLGEYDAVLAELLHGKVAV